MTEELRVAILGLLREHHRSGRWELQEVVHLAKELEQPAMEVLDQLRILQEDELVELAETMGGVEGDTAWITPRGLHLLEQLDNLQGPGQKGRHRSLK